MNRLFVINTNEESGKMGKGISFNKTKSLFGFGLGLLIAIVCFTKYSWKAGVFFLVLYSLTGAIVITFTNPIWLKSARYLWSFMSIVCTAEVSQLLADGQHLWVLPIEKAILEVLCVFAVFLLFYAIINKTKPSWLLSTFVILCLSFANFCVVSFRGNMLIPLDLLSYRTAFNVVGSYAVKTYSIQFYGMALIVLVSFSTNSITNFTEQKKNHNGICNRINSLIAMVLVALSVYIGTRSMHIETFCNHGALFNGYLVNFTAQFVASFRDKRPQDYSLETISNLEKEYDTTSSGETEYPNIIIIMNESFADLSVLGDDLNTVEPVMPFFGSVSDNAIKGRTLSSVFGGGTANSEYEFLTGNTMGFLYDGATVYQLYLNDYVYSMASYLADMGYRCFATHPFLAENWSRPKAWPYLGFEEISFVDDYPQNNLIRTWVSDQEMYEYIVDLYEKNDENAPLFLFGVTMQNHGGFFFESKTESVPFMKLEGYSKEYPDAEQYLGLIRESDKALEWLIHFFENEKEKTVILFYGDHFPKLNQEFYQEVHNGTFDTLPEQQLQYTVPFFVWANYDIEEKDVPITSMNYLSNYVYKVAGIDLPPYNRFLQDIQEVIPALNSKGYYSKQHGTYITYDEAEGEEAEALNRYRILQYNSLFDTENRSEVFFGIGD